MAPLTQVTRHPEMSLKLIERDKEKHSWGMYSVSAGKSDYVIFIKSTSKINRGKQNYSNFTFSTQDIGKLKKQTNDKILICLVCHDEHICCIEKKEIDELKLLNSNKPCRISVYWKKGSELTVKSTFAELSQKVPRKRLKNYEWK
ncbi:MAG: hypothetical protein R6U40_04435 [Desulfobacterales bacterium]